MELFPSEGAGSSTVEYFSDFPSQATTATQGVFKTMGGILAAAVILGLTIHFVKKILSGANKGKAKM